MSRTDPTTHEGKTPARKLAAPALIITALVIAECLSAFELAMMYVALPTLMREFQVDTNQIAWVVTAYLLVSSCAAALGGRLGDLYGRRRVLIVACAIAAFGSIISILGSSLAMLIVGRAVQGAAGAIMGLALGLAREHLPKEKAQTGVAIVGASAVIAGAGGALLAGIMVEGFGWHGIFVFSAALAVMAVLAILIVIPRDITKSVSAKLDVVGAILLPVAVSAMLLGLSFARGVGFSNPLFLVPMAIALVAGAVWLWWELRVESPIVNVRMFKNRQIGLAMTATVFLALGPIGGTVVALSIVMQYPTGVSGGYGLTPTEVGTIAAVTSLIGFGASPIGGILARKISPRFVFVAAGLLMSAYGMIIMLTLGNVVMLIAAQLLMAIGNALFFGALANVLFEAVPQSHSSEVAGTSTMVRNIGQSAATAVAAFLLASYFDPTTGVISQEGFTVTLTILLVFSLIGTALGLLLPRKPTMWVPKVTADELPENTAAAV